MELNRAEFKAIMRRDDAAAFPFERITPAEQARRRVAAPATVLGAGRGRFWELLQRLYPHIEQGSSVCDFGAFPGTNLRLLRNLRGGEKIRLGAAGFGHEQAFIDAMRQLDAAMLDMEFDVRCPPLGRLSHILSFPIEERGGVFDVGVCTDVIEHQMYPLSLLIGINRFIKSGGRVYLTTNSVAFIGDILKLAIGRHNIETLGKSHILNDNLWRPHIRLFTVSELRRLMELAGFNVEEAFYFDNGNVYGGVKGIGMTGLRKLVGIVPHLRSHVFVSAVKASAPTREAIGILDRTLRSYNLQDAIAFETGSDQGKAARCSVRRNRSRSPRSVGKE